MKKVKLNNQAEIPVIGFGTWTLKGKKAQKAVECALSVGYRHIDTADYYRNHAQVAAAIKNSGIAREDLFITTKAWRSDLHKKDVISAGHRFLDELKTDYIDLLLVHWPNPRIPIQETMEGFSALKEDGIIKAIGVSNFSVSQMKEALATGAEITNNQIEYHPHENPEELRKYCQENGVSVTAYSPLGKGAALKIGLVQDLAGKYDKTPAQIILRWLLQKNLIVIPRSTDPQHIEENFAILDWKLSSEDVESMNQIGEA